MNQIEYKIYHQSNNYPYTKKSNNPRWGKSDFQDVFYHKPPGKYENLLWFLFGMLFLLLGSL